MARCRELPGLLRRGAAGYRPGHAGDRCYLTAERDVLADARDERRSRLERLSRTVLARPRLRLAASLFWPDTLLWTDARRGYALRIATLGLGVAGVLLAGEGSSATGRRAVRLGRPSSRMERAGRDDQCSAAMSRTAASILDGIARPMSAQRGSELGRQRDQPRAVPGLGRDDHAL